MAQLNLDNELNNLLEECILLHEVNLVKDIDDNPEEIINSLVLKVHKKCKKKHILFGISPDGNIDNHYNKHKIDVKKFIEIINSDLELEKVANQLFHQFIFRITILTQIIFKFLKVNFHIF